MLWQSDLERLLRTDRRVEFVSPDGSAVVTCSGSGDQAINGPPVRTPARSGSGTTTLPPLEELRNGAESCLRVFKISETEYELVGDDGVYAATMHLK